MKFKVALISGLLLFLQSVYCEAFSQSILVIGKVTNKLTGEPLSGATVSVKGGTESTITDQQGGYTIAVKQSGAVLVITYVGMGNMERTITAAGVQDFQLEGGGGQLDEVVVVGYGTQKKTSLTASVSTIKGSDIQRQPVADLSSALGGRATGVIFTQGGGQAGNDAARIMIRGLGTNGENSAPLLIVDGVPRNYSQLNPADVESFSVLKDAAAVAPYGLGGANGVILVTTRKGKTGKPTLSYDGYVGIQNPTVVTHFVDAYNFALMKNEGAKNAGAVVMPYTEEDLQKFKDGSDPDGHPSIDPLADMVNRNAPMTSHSLSLTGGTDAVKYAFGLGYFNQAGMFPGIKYERYTLSANVQANATKSTQVGLSLNGRVEKRQLSGAGYSTQGLFENLINTNANSTPLIYSNGLEPYIYANYYSNPSYRQVKGNTMLTQFFIEQKLPIKGLSVKFVGSYDFNPYDPFNTDNSGIVSISRAWGESFPFYTVDTTVRPYGYTLTPPNTLPSFTQEYHQTEAFTYQGFINYNGSFGKSNVTGLVVLESRNTNSERFWASRNNYNLPIPELFAGGSGESDLNNDGNSMGTKQRSLVYRVTYAYDSRYLIEAAGRYDGHYYFAPGHRFGFFPAFSAAWRVSEESFMAGISWINELKIRGSYGQSGNLAGKAYQYQPGFGFYGTSGTRNGVTRTSAILNGVQTQGMDENPEPNPNITWEKANKTDIGFEARLFKGLLNIEADYFHEKRANMLLEPSVTVPVEYGVELSQVNAGTMINRGFEFTVSSNYAVTKDINVGFTGNFTYAKNRLVEVFENPATFDNPNLRQTGRSYLTPFGYQSLGFFKPEDFDGSGNLLPGIAKQTFTDKVFPGDIRYADVSGPDGKPDGLIDFNDQIAMGYPTYPAIIYGFSPSVSWKGLELSLLFQGAGQREIQIENSAAWAFDNNKNAPVTSMDYWTPDNQDATYPRMTTSPSANNSQRSTFWQRSVSYLRLRTGTLGYTIPNNITRKIGMSIVNVYLSGQNLITWTPIKNFDPEISNARGWYFPTQKAVTVGLRVQF